MLSPLVRIVDDETLVRDSEAFVIELLGLPVVQYESAEEFLARDDLSRPGCIVLDINMEGISGLEMQRILARKNVSLPIIFVTGHGNVAAAVQALKLGAADFVEKPMDAEKLQASVQKLVHWHLEHCRNELQLQRCQQKYALLTEREKHVAILLAQGLPGKLVARQLGISVETVKNHKKNIYDKLDVKTAVDVLKILQCTNALQKKHITENDGMIYRAHLIEVTHETA